MHVKDTTTLAFMEEILFVLTLKEDILEVKGMMMPVICMESKMVCNLYSLKIALMYIMYCFAH
jgi:hypothetical protein